MELPTNPDKYVIAKGYPFGAFIFSNVVKFTVVVLVGKI